MIRLNVVYCIEVYIVNAVSQLSLELPKCLVHGFVPCFNVIDYIVSFVVGYVAPQNLSMVSRHFKFFAVFCQSYGILLI